MSAQDASSSTGSPGFSVRAALDQLSESGVCEAIGPQAFEMLRAIDPRYMTLAALRKAAAALIEPLDVATDARLRRLVINALPNQKAEELARRAGVDPGPDLQTALLEGATGVMSSPEKRAAMLEFFGLDASSQSRDSLVRDTLAEPAYSLFEHQHRAAVDVARRLAAAPHKVMLHMPTGSGKTRTAMHIIARHMNSREAGIVCWLAQSQELLNQAADEFEKCWRQLGSRPAEIIRFWGDKNFPALLPRQGLIVAGYAKLSALLARDPNTVLRLADLNSLTVVDEAHQAIAPTYRDAIETLSLKRAGTQLLGLSATPGRTWSDISADAELSTFFGEQKVTLRIQGYSDPVKYLIDEGYLARPSFRTLNGAPGLKLADSDLEALRRGLDLSETILENLAEDQQRNLRILSEVQDLTLRHSRVIVFATTVAHARLLSAVLQAMGTTAFAVDGGTSAEVRDRAIRRFKSADARAMVLCNFGVLTTGFDAPRTSAAIIARPTRSLVLYSQMVGRAIRGPRAGGNAEAEIVTVVDPALPGFGDMSEAFMNWEDVWHDPS